MRLIDADKLQNRIIEGAVDVEKHMQPETAILCNEFIQGIVKDIEEQPTVSASEYINKAQADIIASLLVKLDKIQNRNAEYIETIKDLKSTIEGLQEDVADLQVELETYRGENNE